jgi:hypothetical protein
MSGKVRIYRISPNGGETSINLFFPTDILGEFATIDSEPCSATAKAIGRCTLLQMSQERFLHHMGQLPGLALAMTRLLSKPRSIVSLLFVCRWFTYYDTILTKLRKWENGVIEPVLGRRKGGTCVPSGAAV